MRSHKYIKRTGSKGAYKYWYKLPDGRIVAGDSPEGAAAGHSQEKGKAEHLKRLIAGRIHGHHEMTHKQIAEHVGTEEKKVRWAQSNMSAAGRRAAAAGRATGTAAHGHDFEEHHMKEAKHEDVTHRDYHAVSTAGGAPDRAPARAGHRGTHESSSGEQEASKRRPARPATPTPEVSGDASRAPAARAALREASDTGRDNATLRAAGFSAHGGGGYGRYVTHGSHRIVKVGDKWQLHVHHAHLGDHMTEYSELDRAIVNSTRISVRHQKDMARRNAAAEAAPVAPAARLVRILPGDGAHDPSQADGGAANLNAAEDKAEKRRKLREKLAREHNVNFDAPAAAPAAEAPAAPAQSPEQARQQAAKAAQRAQANAAPTSAASRAMHAASPDLAAADEPIQRMIEAQAAGENPYFNRAVEIYNNIINDVKPKRKAVVNHMMQALNNMKGRGEAWNEANLVKEYKRLSGSAIQGLSVVGKEFERATFITMEELLGNAPINPEVERMKRGYAAKQFARLKPYLKDSFSAAHPGAPPPYPTYGDIKKWSEHSGPRPSWASSHPNAIALPKEVHDAAAKGADGKPKHPPAWMPIHLAPVWNYIVKGTMADGKGEDPYRTRSPVNSQGRVDVANQASSTPEGYAVNAMRKYIQMRGGPDQLVDIPSHKLAEVGLSHSDIFKAEKFGDNLSDANIKKIIKHKIVDPCALQPFLAEAMKAKPIKKSFSLVIDEETRPVTFKKSFTVDLEKSEIIRKIKELKKAKATV